VSDRAISILVLAAAARCGKRNALLRFQWESSRAGSLHIQIYFGLCSRRARATSKKRVGLRDTIAKITDAAEELAGRASYDVDDDRRYAALNRSGVGDRNFLRVHTAVSGKDVAVDRRGMGFSLQQNRCRDCGNAARCFDLGDAGNLCRRISSRVLEPSASGSPTCAFSPVWFARLHALARIFAGRLAHLLARLCWFAFSGHSLCDHCLFSHAPADQPRKNPAIVVFVMLSGAKHLRLFFSRRSSRNLQRFFALLRMTLAVLEKPIQRNTLLSVCESECAD